MTERERLLEKLAAVKALADRGVDGEKAAAENRLRLMMEKYGITEADLEDASVRLYWIRYKTEYERRLLYQLAYKYTGSGHAHGCVGTYTGRSRKKVGIDCTTAQYIEIEADFEFYRAALAEEMELFYTAFINKNRLFPPPELAGDIEDSGEIDLVRLGKLQAMMGGIEQRSRNKALTEGSEDNE
jgi:hypothetical protein